MCLVLNFRQEHVASLRPEKDTSETKEGSLATEDPKAREDFLKSTLVKREPSAQSTGTTEKDVQSGIPEDTSIQAVPVKMEIDDNDLTSNSDEKPLETALTDFQVGYYSTMSHLS